MLSNIRKIAKQQMWTEDKLVSELDTIKKYAPGGQIRIDERRITIAAGNTDALTIVIKDTSDKEIYREELYSQVPYYSGGQWLNVGLVDIAKKIRPPFYVYVVDRFEDRPFKFEIIHN